MALKFFPNRVFNGKENRIDRQSEVRRPLTERQTSDINTAVLDFVVSADKGWQVNSIRFTFDSTVARDYSAKIKQGRKIISDINDSLWFHTTNTLPQRIFLDAGFYNGTELASELKTQMDANTAYSDLGITFTITYSASTGKFTITPSSGTLKYLDVNTQQVHVIRDSVAGHLFGFEADTSFAGSITSDTEVFGLNEEAAFGIDETASVVLSDVDDDVRTFSVDEALHILTSTAASTLLATATVTYEELP